MSNVWTTRYRLLCEHCEELAKKLSGEQPITPEVLEELVVQLLAPALTLLRQHAMNKRGQCKFCGWTRWKWRFWRRRRPCTVFQALDLTMRRGPDIAWWQLFATIGNEVSLADVREWLSERNQPVAAAASPGVADDPG